MALDGVKIRRKILEILDNSGQVRSTELVNEVIKSLGVSQKPVYDTLKFLSIDNRVIIKNEINRAEIWYEAKDFEQTTSNFIKFYESKLSKFDKLLKDWHDRVRNDPHIEYLQHQLRLQPLIKALQNISTHYNLMSNAEMFKQSKKFKDLKKEIEKRHTELIGSTHILKNKKKLQDILYTLEWEIDNKFFTQYDNYIHPKIVHEPK